MSGFRRGNRGGGRQPYNHHAKRLREKLNSREHEHDEEAGNSKFRHPAGLRGKEIGLWYAKNKPTHSQLAEDSKLLNGPCLTLPEVKIRELRNAIERQKSISREKKSTKFRNEFKRHVESDFFEMLSSISTSSVAVEQQSEIDERLYDDFINKSLSEEYITMLESRQKLPAYQHKDEIVKHIESNQVVLVEGATGSGKTTQVPQYILDSALINKKASTTRIICTQPRRIAAISVADRVASERAEPLGQSVGYQIRLEKIKPRSYGGTITFCTTGVLTKFMESDPTLRDVSHIIIDEIHERNVQTDICLALIKHIVRHRKNLKVVLMSATLNAQQFSEYFDDCPIIHIEGFTYPVQELFLEDVIEETGFDHFRQSRSNRNWKHRNVEKRNREEFEVIVVPYVNSLRGRYSRQTIETLKIPETEMINVDFIESLLYHISTSKPLGAILVILPGFQVISKLFKMMNSLKNRYPSDKFVIYPVHSMLTGNDQRNIFIHPPDGVWKVILSTPICETSITIDDVIYVINAGRCRKPYFDFDLNANVLEDQWITKANETQRKGRAGRVRKGICYHLYTKARSNTFEMFETPEILKICLEEVLLTIKVLCIKNLKQFMSTLIDVPKESVIDKSIEILQRLGALTETENLTPLGLHLANLSVHPRIGKMLLIGSILNCFDPIASAAASLSFKSPFYTVMGKEEECNRAKRAFSNDSDQLAVVNAMKQWSDSEQNDQQNSFCHQNFLSHTTLLMLERMKTQFSQMLHKSKFIRDSCSDAPENNFHSNDLNVLRATICAGLYPNIAYRTIRIKGSGRRVEKIKTISRFVKHLPSSVNADKDHVYDPGYLMYHELNKFSGNYFLSETTTNIPPYAILMFGDRLETDFKDETHFISVGGIAKFKCNPETAQLIIDLREGFMQILESKIEEPSAVDLSSDAEGHLIMAIMKLISMDHKSFDGYEQDALSQDDDMDE